MGGSASWPQEGGGPAFEDLIVTLDSAAQNLDITGLDGETDGDYEFWFDLFAATDAGGGNALSLQPESLATNQVGEILYSAGGTPGGADTAIMPFGTNNAGADVHIIGHGWLTSKSGRNRFFECSTRYSTSVSIRWTAATTWTGTATPITMLRFHSSQASGIKAGSYVRLRKLGNVT